MLQSITNMRGTTYRIGQKVRSTDGWVGTITAIRGDRLLVNPANIEDVPQYLRWALNPEAAERAGRADYCLPRDSGQSMGNFEPLKG